MKFTLYYEGPLKGNNRRAEEKNKIRSLLSPQIEQLWKANGNLRGLFDHHADDFRWHLDGCHFQCLAVGKYNLHCKLEIFLLTPAPEGSPLRAGDLDNRIKTLIDSLRRPRQQQELTGLQENCKDAPLFVLMEDDDLVTSISARTEVLLGATPEQIQDGFTRAIIAVEVYPTDPTILSIGLMS